MSVGSSSCCGPDEWEALAVASAAYGYHMASSHPLTGRLSVSHSRNIAALWLMSEIMGNVTIVVNDSQIFFYFMLTMRDRSESKCSAYILENVIADLSDRCMSDNSSPMDRLKSALGSLPANLVVYEYAGLAGLVMAQLISNRHDCSPSMFAVSTHSDNDSPMFNVQLSDIKSVISDRSMLDDIPTQCLGVLPLTINMRRLGSRRRSGLGSLGGLLPVVSSRDQWINDLVALYIINSLTMRDDDDSGSGSDTTTLSRRRRDLSDLIGLSDHRSSDSLRDKVKDILGLDDHHDTSHTINIGDVLDDAISLRLMLQALNQLFGRSQPDISDLLPMLKHGDDKSALDSLLPWILLKKLTADHDTKDDDADDDSTLLDKLLGRDHKDDDKSPLDKLLPLILLKKLSGDRDDKDDDDRSVFDKIFGHDDKDDDSSSMFDKIFGHDTKDDDKSTLDKLLPLILLKKLSGDRDDKSDDDRSMFDKLLGRDTKDDGDDDLRSALISSILPGGHRDDSDDDSKSLLDKLLGDDRDDHSDDKSNFVESLVKMMVAMNVLSDGRRPMDSDDIKALCTFLVERNILDSIDKSHSKNDQLKSMLVSIAKVKAVQNLLQALKRVTLYNKMSDQHDHADSLEQLLKMTLLGSSISDQKDDKPDFSDLLKMMLRQQSQDWSRRRD
jgi:hypothetical protein